MMRSTFSPAISPASLVACRWASLKYAGTVMTASVTFSPRYSSASRLSLPRMRAEISCAVYFLSSMVTDQSLTSLGESDDGRRRAAALGVRDDGGLAAFEDGDDGVRRAQVDADRSCHGWDSLRTDQRVRSAPYPDGRPGRLSRRDSDLPSSRSLSTRD